MPVNRSEHTTPTPTPATTELSSPQHLVQQAFHQHLRGQIRNGVRIVMEEMMREKLTLSSSS